MGQNCLTFSVLHTMRLYSSSIQSSVSTVTSSLWPQATTLIKGELESGEQFPYSQRACRNGSVGTERERGAGRRRAGLAAQSRAHLPPLDRGSGLGGGHAPHAGPGGRRRRPRALLTCAPRRPARPASPTESRSPHSPRHPRSAAGAGGGSGVRDGRSPSRRLADILSRTETSALPP
ncbi:uncharacterized protein LOC116557141 [Sapajus apella]|uniref:Uncharacterized protein LOC116557141 n=1 Tax=Sapajus apella TaxID=9515 RepID=A0A6J3IJ39_SAPAP|nr:uncharacterized protein LOC116557141 [Sapajus apella]